MYLSWTIFKNNFLNSKNPFFPKSRKLLRIFNRKLKKPRKSKLKKVSSTLKAHFPPDQASLKKIQKIKEFKIIEGLILKLQITKKIKEKSLNGDMIKMKYFKISKEFLRPTSISLLRKSIQKVKKNSQKFKISERIKLNLFIKFMKK